MKTASGTSKHRASHRDEGRCTAGSALCFIIGSYLLGGVSLLLWVAFLSRGALGVVELGLGQMGALLFDAFLSLVFFTQHSVMVRTSFKKWMAKRIRQEYHGAVYAMASGIALLGVSVLWQGPVQKYGVLGGIPRFIMQGTSFLALFGFIWGVRSLGSFDMFGSGSIVRSLRGEGPREPMPLTIRGPYRWVRHPLYFFCLMAIWSVTEITVDRLLYNVMWTGWIVLGAMLEERDLGAAFGSAYQVYKAKVPMLIPRRITPVSSAFSSSLAGRLCDGQSIK